MRPRSSRRKIDGTRTIKALFEESGGTLDPRAVLVSLLLTGICSAATPLIDVSLTAPAAEPASPQAAPSPAPAAPVLVPGARADVTVQTPPPKVLTRMAGARALAQRLAPHGLGKQVGTMPGTGLGRALPTGSGTGLGKQVGTGPGHTPGRPIPVGAGQVPVPQKREGSSPDHSGVERRAAPQASKTDPRLTARAGLSAWKEVPAHGRSGQHGCIAASSARPLMDASAEVPPVRPVARVAAGQHGGRALERARGDRARGRRPDPNLAFPRYVLGRLALASGDVKHAKLLFKFAVKLDATLLDAQRYLRLIDLRKGTATPADAFQVFKLPGTSKDQDKGTEASPRGRLAPPWPPPRSPCCARMSRRPSRRTSPPPVKAVAHTSGSGCGRAGTTRSAPASPQPTASDERDDEPGPTRDSKAADMIATMLREATAEAAAPAQPAEGDGVALAAHADEPAGSLPVATAPAAEAAVAVASRSTKRLAPRWIVLSGMIVGCVVGGALVYVAIPVSPRRAPIGVGPTPSPRSGPPAGSAQTRAAGSASATTSAVASRPTPSASVAAAPSSSPAPSASVAATGPVPSSTAVGSAAPPASATPPAQGAPGVLVVPASAGSHRVWVDGKLVGQSPLKLNTTCGTHTVQVGSNGKPYSVEVACP